MALAYISLQETSIDIADVVDDEKIGEKFLGSVIKDPAILDSISYDRILITSVEKRDTTFEKILANGISRKKVVMIE